MTSMLDHNVAFVRDADTVDLKNALLDAASRVQGGKLEIAREAEVSSQIYDIHCVIGREERAKLERALVGAATSWKSRWHGYDALAQLILAAGYIQCAEVVDAIRLLIDNPLFNPCASSRTVDAVKHIFSVLGGLGPVAKPTLERAFYDRRFETKFAAILLNGLCLCVPERYPSYFRQFLTIANRVPPYYDLSDVTNEMVECVRPHVIIEHLTKLEADRNAFDLLCSVLGTGERKLTIDENRDITLRDENGAVLPLQIRSAAANASAARAAMASVKPPSRNFNNYFKQRAGRLPFGRQVYQ